MLGGDTVGIPVPDLRTLIVAATCVVASYLVWMGPIYIAMEKVTVKPLSASWKESRLPDDDRSISIFVFALQLSFLGYCLIEKMGVAGSIERSRCFTSAYDIAQSLRRMLSRDRARLQEKYGEYAKWL